MLASKPTHPAGAAARAARKRSTEASRSGAIGTLNRRQPAAQSSSTWAATASGPSDGG